MCHLILLMPVLALPIFWLMQLNMAIPIYLVILLISGLFYRLIVKSMRKQPQTGSESLIGTVAEVVSKLGPADHAQYLVRSRGELWSANSNDALRNGETVSIVAMEGIRLVVRRNSHPARQTEDGRGLSARHCH